MTEFKMKVTPEIENLTEVCKEHSSLDLSLYQKYDVKRGLRDINGKGVLAGLTQISNVCATKVVDGKEVPCAGSLSYRGYDIKELTRGFIEDDRYGFEETTYLLLFGKLPNEEELEDFTKLLANQRSLPTNFVRDVIMKAPSKDIMNALSRSVLTLYCYDKEPDDISLPNVLRQCLNLISVFPLLSVYGYQAYNHYVCGKSLYIHNPKKELSTAENILRMLRPDKKYSHLEAKILDLALILHTALSAAHPLQARRAPHPGSRKPAALRPHDPKKYGADGRTRCRQPGLYLRHAATRLFSELRPLPPPGNPQGLHRPLSQSRGAYHDRAEPPALQDALQRRNLPRHPARRI